MITSCCFYFSVKDEVIFQKPSKASGVKPKKTLFHFTTRVQKENKHCFKGRLACIVFAPTSKTEKIVRRQNASYCPDPPLNSFTNINLARGLSPHTQPPFYV